MNESFDQQIDQVPIDNDIDSDKDSCSIPIRSNHSEC